jgi:hypothetical protein
VSPALAAWGGSERGGKDPHMEVAATGTADLYAGAGSGQGGRARDGERDRTTGPEQALAAGCTPT